MSGWKPIASAPRDGRDILVALTGGAVGIVYWDGLWQVPGGWYGGPLSEVNMTHWRPLPFPPAKSRTRVRSAKHGQFASKDDADASPDTHIRETVGE